MTEQDSSLVCNISALSPQQHARRRELASRLRPMVRQVVPMSDGYALRLEDQGEVLTQVAEFIKLERLCCPFLKFQLEVEADGGSTWLRMGGRGAAQELLAGAVGSQGGSGCR